MLPEITISDECTDLVCWFYRSVHGFLKQVNRVSAGLNDFGKRQGKRDKFSCKEG